MPAPDRGAHGAEDPLSCPLALRERAGVRGIRRAPRPRACPPHPHPLPEGEGTASRTIPAASDVRVQGRGRRRPACISLLTLSKRSATHQPLVGCAALTHPTARPSTCCRATASRGSCSRAPSGRGGSGTPTYRTDDVRPSHSSSLGAGASPARPLLPGRWSGGPWPPPHHESLAHRGRGRRHAENILE